jgi:hypothetical protein
MSYELAEVNRVELNRSSVFVDCREMRWNRVLLPTRLSPVTGSARGTINTPKMCSPSSAMATSPYNWKSLTFERQTTDLEIVKTVQSFISTTLKWTLFFFKSFRAINIVPFCKIRPLYGPNNNMPMENPCATINTQPPILSKANSNLGTGDITYTALVTVLLLIFFRLPFIWKRHN